MCFDERKTWSRGRAFAVVASVCRTRRRRRAKRSSVLLVMAPSLLLLALLAADGLVDILDALALVGLGLAVAADHGGDLADALPVGAADRDRRRLLADDLHVVGDREIDVVAVAQLQHQVLALDRGAISDAVDLEIAREALRDARDHIVDEGARRAPQH